MWVIRKLNFNLKEAGEKRLLKLNELEELHNDSYENAKIYKEKTKRWHDKDLLRTEFAEGDKVLIFNSKLKLFPGKLRSRWSRPVIVTLITPYGVIGVQEENGHEFEVNNQRLKHYFGEQIAKETLTTLPYKLHFIKRSAVSCSFVELSTLNIALLRRQPKFCKNLIFHFYFLTLFHFFLV